MPVLARAVLVLPLLLAGCATPQQRCLSGATAALRPVDRLIAETEATISRGYGLQATTVYRTVWVPCWGGYGTYGYRTGGGMCLDEQAQIIEQPVAVDIAAEKRKLAQLKAKRRDLAAQAAPEVAECRALYPE